MSDNITNWLTVKEAAERAPGGAMTTANMRYLLQGGKIKGKRIGRQWLVDPDSLAKYEPQRSTRRKRIGAREL